MEYSVEVARRSVYVNGILAIPIRGNKGGYRLVAEFGNGLIVKADFNHSDRKDADPKTYQTEFERLMLDEIVPSDRKYFPTILDHGTYTKRGSEYSWIIQAKVKFKRCRVDKQVSSIMKRLIWRYDLDDLGDVVEGCKPYGGSNWGINMQGRPVIFDFGFNMYFTEFAGDGSD